MARRRKDEIFEESLFNNLQDYQNFEDRLIDLAVGRFDILDLPTEIFKPFVIKKIITEREVLFFRDDILDNYICYPYTSSSPLDIYNRPIGYRVNCPNGYYRDDLNNSNSVIIRGSISGLPIMDIIKQYARKLYLISRTIDINVNAQKTPIILTCDENDRLSVEQLYQKYTGNQPIIKTVKGFDVENVFSVLKTDAPIVFNQLYELQCNIWNEYLTFLGISNVTIQKKERLNTDEVTRGLGGVIVARNNFVTTMKDGIDQANKMFGLNMKLVFGGEIVKDPDEVEQEEQQALELTAIQSAEVNEDE